MGCFTDDRGTRKSHPDCAKKGFTLFTFSRLQAVLVITALIAATPVAAGEVSDVLKLHEVSLGYKDFFPGGVSPLVTQNGIPNRELGKEVELKLNTDIWDIFFFNNRVHGTTDEVPGTDKGQFRAVGWEFEFGLRFADTLPMDIFYHHHSQHVLDTTSQIGHFPVEDAIGVQFIIFQRNDKRESLFK